jgi:hypothetical protein
MRITIEPTNQMDDDETGRTWTGRTEGGILVYLHITSVAVSSDVPASDFDPALELRLKDAPSPDVCAHPAHRKFRQFV